MGEGRFAQLLKKVLPTHCSRVHMESPGGLTCSARFNLHCQLRLNSGIPITLESLEQEMTYAQLLEGTPCPEWNDELLQKAIQHAESRYSWSGKPHLIVPPRRDYEFKPGDMRKEAQRNSMWVPEFLPTVRCVGSFRSPELVRDPNKCLSVLPIVWFQDDYALPILDPALSQLLDVDWGALALDVDL